MENLLHGGYEGPLYAVNPGYETVRGVPCFPDLASLPETVEHVVLTLGDANVDRITSYNVCYTKLLRCDRHRS